jgi:hypothetical protein
MTFSITAQKVPLSETTEEPIALLWMFATSQQFNHLKFSVTATVSSLDAFLSLHILPPFGQNIRLGIFLNSVIVTNIDSLLDLIDSLDVNCCFASLSHTAVKD